MGQVLDFTAYKLQEMANSLDNPDEVEVVLGILGDYFEGEVAIAWEYGYPVVMPTSADYHSTRGIPAGFMMVGHQPELIGEDSGEG